MDKNAIKKYAVWARKELITRVGQRAVTYGVSEDNVGDPNVDSVGGRLLSPTEKSQRQALIRKVKEDGYEQVMEEVAYTWFNRFAALRFMEVNGYLPSHVRVFTNDAGEFKPQILAEAIHLELDGLDRGKVYALEQANKAEELFKYLLIVQCNALSSILPGMFQRINDYTELLLPDNLLREGSVIERMVRQNAPDSIPEEDWTDQVQIIGWLYQYYISEKKDKVFADLKKNIKISKENIPAATQLFTPDWIVHYMVENSLGRLWLEGHPNDDLKAQWQHYLDEAEQEPDVQAQLAGLRKEYATIKPEDIRVIDPCMGSGHILCVLFDVLVQIYEDYGYTAREAAAKIMENNLYGLDIDDRAAQLAYFSVMMKARQYDRRYFAHPVQPQVYSTASFKEGKEYGSLLLTDDPGEMFGENGQLSLYDSEWYVRKLLAQKYDVVVTNPPYMATSNVVSYIGDHIKKDYPDSKADFFAAFIERCKRLTKPNRYQAMITQHTWMFLSSYEKLRSKLKVIDIVNLLHFGPRAFEEIGGEVVQTSSFILRQSSIKDYQGIYCRLVDPTSQQGKEDMFLSGESRFVAKQSSFSKIPGSPVAYWVSTKVLTMFSGEKVSDFGQPRQGLASGDNDQFLRFWFEICYNSFSTSIKSVQEIDTEGVLYVPHNKGGNYRKWYGNLQYIIRYNQFNRRKLSEMGNHLPSRDYYFRRGVTWSDLTSGIFGARWIDCGATFDTTGPTFFSYNGDENLEKYLLGYFNSNTFYYLTRIFCSGLHYSNGVLATFPCTYSAKYVHNIIRLVEDNIILSRTDWDSFETSWDFQQHPLVRLAPFSTEEMQRDLRCNGSDQGAQ